MLQQHKCKARPARLAAHSSGHVMRGELREHPDGRTGGERGYCQRAARLRRCPRAHAILHVPRFHVAGTHHDERTRKRARTVRHSGRADAVTELRGGQPRSILPQLEAPTAATETVVRTDNRHERASFAGRGSGGSTGDVGPPRHHDAAGAASGWGIGDDPDAHTMDIKGARSRPGVMIPGRWRGDRSSDSDGRSLHIAGLGQPASAGPCNSTGLSRVGRRTQASAWARLNLIELEAERCSLDSL
jgi:hypothetical protein